MLTNHLREQLGQHPQWLALQDFYGPHIELVDHVIGGYVMYYVRNTQGRNLSTFDKASPQEAINEAYELMQRDKIQISAPDPAEAARVRAEAYARGEAVYAAPDQRAQPTEFQASHPWERQEAEQALLEIDVAFNAMKARHLTQTPRETGVKTMNEAFKFLDWFRLAYPDKAERATRGEQIGLDFRTVAYDAWVSALASRENHQV